MDAFLTSNLTRHGRERNKLTSPGPHRWQTGRLKSRPDGHSKCPFITRRCGPGQRESFALTSIVDVRADVHPTPHRDVFVPRIGRYIFDLKFILDGGWTSRKIPVKDPSIVSTFFGRNFDKIIQFLVHRTRHGRPASHQGGVNTCDAFAEKKTPPLDFKVQKVQGKYGNCRHEPPCRYAEL